MSTPIEEGAAAAQRQADIDTLKTLFQKQLAIQVQLFEENTLQQDLLKDASANAQNPYDQLVYLMYAVNEHGMIPTEALEFEAEQQPTSASAESAQDCYLCEEEAYYNNMFAYNFEASSAENASGEDAEYKFCEECMYYQMQTGQTTTPDDHEEEEVYGYATIDTTENIN